MTRGLRAETSVALLAASLWLFTPGSRAAAAPVESGPRVPAPTVPVGGADPSAETERVYGDLGLEPEPDGSWTYVDPAGHFTARFVPDGTVEFADRWKRPDRYDRDNGRCCARPPPAPSIAGGQATSGPIEWVAKIAGEDLNARSKAELLRKTAALRTRLAVAHAEDLLDRALARLGEQLRALWDDESLSPAARRERLFELWDECDELVPSPANPLPEAALSELDRLRLDAAWQGRRRIEAWIRHHLPETHLDAYTPEELAELDERRLSAEPFEPYVVKPKRRPEPEPASLPSRQSSPLPSADPTAAEQSPP